MKRLLIAFALIPVAVTLFAQGIPEPGLEDWDTNSSFGFEYPKDWTVSTTYYGTTSGKTVVQDTNRYSGLYSACLRTILFGFGMEPSVAYMSTGNTVIDGLGTPQLMTGGIPLTAKPYAIQGYYRYNSTSAGDSGEVFVISKKWNASTKTADTVAYGFGKLGTATTWTYFSLAVKDLMPGTTPDSVVVAFMSTNQVIGAPDLPGGVLWVDDISLILDTLDGGVKKLIGMPDSVQVNTSTPVEVMVQNYLHNDIPEMDVAFSENGNELNIEMYPDTLLAWDSATYTFTTNYTPTTIGTKWFCAYTKNIANEFDHENDSTCKNVVVTGTTDIGVSRILNPAPDVIKDDTSYLQVMVRNYGHVHLDSFRLKYTIDGSVQSTEIFPGTLMAGDSAQFDFAQWFIHNTFDPVEICAYTDLAGDDDINNDTVCHTFDIAVAPGIEHRSSFTLVLYPNPADQILLVSSNRVLNEKVTITNLTGQTIYSSILEKDLTIDVRNLHQGIYFLKVGDVVRKFSVVH